MVVARCGWGWGGQEGGGASQPGQDREARQCCEAFLSRRSLTTTNQS